MENHSDTDLVKLRERLMKGELRPGFEIYNGFLCYQNRYCIGSNSNLRIIILEELHNSQIGGGVTQVISKRCCELGNDSGDQV